MQRTLIIGVLLAVVLAACGGSAPDVEATSADITVYKPPT